MKIFQKPLISLATVLAGEICSYLGGEVRITYCNAIPCSLLGEIRRNPLPPILKMEAGDSPETSVVVYCIASRHFQERNNLHKPRPTDKSIINFHNDKRGYKQENL
jgi:hypothetical protein